MQPDYWHKALKHLSKDKKMAQLIAQFPNLTLTSRGNAFETLLRSVVGQQISISAADNIWQRLVKHLSILTPNQVINQPKESLKNIGLSAQKASYLHNIAYHFLNHNIDKNYFYNRDFNDIREELTAIKGVGSWTVEMFGIFYLLEPDIFPIKDIGLIRAISRLYQLPIAKPDKQVIINLAQNWQPYRTVATWYLWRSIDAEVVQY